MTFCSTMPGRRLNLQKPPRKSRPMPPVPIPPHGTPAWRQYNRENQLCRTVEGIVLHRLKDIDEGLIAASIVDNPIAKIPTKSHFIRAFHSSHTSFPCPDTPTTDVCSVYRAVDDARPAHDRRAPASRRRDGAGSAAMPPG